LWTAYFWSILAMTKLWVPLPGLFGNWERNFLTMKWIWEKNLIDIVWWNTSWNIVITCYIGQIDILIFFLISQIQHLVTTWLSKKYLSKMFTENKDLYISIEFVFKYSYEFYMIIISKRSHFDDFQMPILWDFKQNIKFTRISNQKLIIDIYNVQTVLKQNIMFINNLIIN
jgi:hypothetical protein